MSEVPHQLLITLVHGTWGRGFSPRLVRFKQWLRELTLRKRSAPFWFEEGSPFLARLSAGLGDIPHKIWPLLWSGANSIFVRDKTAHALADHLSAEHAEHPQATQLVIAHSHGGNIALRALYHLRQRADGTKPLVVTLATPFVEVHPADFGRRPFFIRVALTLFVIIPLVTIITLPLILFISLLQFLFFPFNVFLFDGISIIVMVLFFYGLAFYLIGRWLFGRATARQGKVDALTKATRLESGAAHRLLVIRAIDDEASLSLALGATLNYLSARSITYVLLLLLVTASFERYLSTSFQDLVTTGLIAGCYILLGLLIFSRALHGRELAVSPMECQINTQPAPDAKGLSEIITLVRRKYAKSLRHGIYDHEDCAKTISDWVHSQLRGPPAK
jgi:hypothetical protein